jgi:hypothetical protein
LGRNATASPSISALSAGSVPIAAAILGNRSVKSAPYRVHKLTLSPCLRATIR